MAGGASQNDLGGVGGATVQLCSHMGIPARQSCPDQALSNDLTL